jgi:ribonuclease P protein component
MKEHGFPKSARLLKPAEFDRVFARRCTASDANIVLHAALGITAEPRLGLVVSRKCGNAVTRNRWKRGLREAFRLVRGELAVYDFVVVPRAGTTPSVAELQQSFRELSERIAKRLRSASKEPS